VASKPKWPLGRRKRGRRAPGTSKGPRSMQLREVKPKELSHLSDFVVCGLALRGLFEILEAQRRSPDGRELTTSEQLEQNLEWKDFLPMPARILKPHRRLAPEVIWWPEDVPLLEDDELPWYGPRDPRGGRRAWMKVVKLYFDDPEAVKIVLLLIDIAWEGHGPVLWTSSSVWKRVMRRLGYVVISNRVEVKVKKTPKKAKRGSSGK